jgi:RND family efflux transporter MFP subunit
MTRLGWWVIVVSAVLAGCDRSRPAPSPPTAVKVATVEQATPSALRHFTAQIKPAVRLDLAFKVGGYVESIAMTTGVDGRQRPVQDGDPVHEGMQLAALRRTDYTQKLAETQAALSQTYSSLQQAQLDLRRSKKLADNDAVAGAELDEARTRSRGAAAGLAGAKARRDQAASALADTVLRAPFDGVVLRRAIEIGTLVNPGMIGFSIADVTDVKAAFGVPDTLLPKLELGAPETITSDAYPGATFAGKISLISPSADPKGRVFDVEVTIPNADGRLKTGSVVSLELGGGSAQVVAAPLVPFGAIVRSPHKADGFAVLVVDHVGDHDVVHAIDVELGENVSLLVPVVKGVRGGERVVVQGAGLLSDGETVEVIP